MVEFAGMRQAQGTSRLFSYSGVARFESSTLEVNWEAHVSTSEGRLPLCGTAQGVLSAPLTKASAMQAVADAIDLRFGNVASSA
jgi:hypothetical protein